MQKLPFPYLRRNRITWVETIVNAEVGPVESDGTWAFLDVPHLILSELAAGVEAVHDRQDGPICRVSAINSDTFGVVAVPVDMLTARCRRRRSGCAGSDRRRSRSRSADLGSGSAGSHRGELLGLDGSSR